MTNGTGAKVLIVEDEEPLALLLRYNLEAAGHSVEVVYRGDEVELQLAENSPDLIILDWMLPGISGLELCRRIRTNRESRHIPIILLTARSEENDRIRGLTTGADDYVVKPFSVPELMARVQAIMRRTNPERIASVLSAGDIELDRVSHRVTRNGRPIHLGPTEFRLLEFLMQSPGRVFSRAQLLDGVWGRNVYVDERTVDVHIGRLRKAMMNDSEQDPVRTVRGAGYAFSDALETASA
ncbi:phosphate regulon transcriptional regulator PhoB [Methyloligella solikamskensis]|uniref:Phosphate regulon transcriptional regulatory protein PhoB n=1 Tax=Methyloligella solikamskensis TaxID=1177756 RepID=A0ABW3JF75_9HYPH